MPSAAQSAASSSPACAVATIGVPASRALAHAVALSCGSASMMQTFSPFASAATAVCLIFHGRFRLAGAEPQVQDSNRRDEDRKGPEHAVDALLEHEQEDRVHENHVVPKGQIAKLIPNQLGEGKEQCAQRSKNNQTGRCAILGFSAHDHADDESKEYKTDHIGPNEIGRLHPAKNTTQKGHFPEFPSILRQQDYFTKSSFIGHLAILQPANPLMYE
ncbi:hypothetical protein [Ensifer sp. SL37]|uniref:hypothetical protein n=1 Tax=Ensifer sp. SL37 TaxID=2995137 RepID=UPI0022761F11|nr:hypothetical protein [Ensifer sp. SL37]MCY1740685.1 hypothetical protein [Ensifer sp. SL37]